MPFIFFLFCYIAPSLQRLINVVATSLSVSPPRKINLGNFFIGIKWKVKTVIFMLHIFLCQFDESAFIKGSWIKSLHSKWKANKQEERQGHFITAEQGSSQTPPTSPPTLLGLRVLLGPAVMKVPAPSHPPLTALQRVRLHHITSASHPFLAGGNGASLFLSLLFCLFWKVFFPVVFGWSRVVISV